MPANTIISYPLAKQGTQFTTGKRFWVSDVTGASWNDLNLQYPPDQDGTTRVHTTVTLALAQAVSGRGDEIILASDFVTALTAAEILSAETKGVAVLSHGKLYSTTPRVVERATATLPQTTSAAIFTISGKVKLLSIIGTVTTAIQNQACTGQLIAFNNGADLIKSINLCATASLASDPINCTYFITGTLATALQSTQFAGLYQAAPIMIGPGTTNIRLKASASNTGSVKWRVEYTPLEPGATVIAA